MEISVISVQSVVKNKKKFTTDNTEIHGFKIHNLNKRKKISPLLPAHARTEQKLEIRMIWVNSWHVSHLFTSDLHKPYLLRIICLLPSRILIPDITMFSVYLELIILMLELFKKQKSINRKDRRD